MQSLSPTNRSQPATDDDAIHWLRAHGWTIGCAGSGDEWMITGYKLGHSIKGTGTSLMNALLAAWEQAQEKETVSSDGN